MKRIAEFFHQSQAARKGLRDFNRCPRDKKGIVFYAENAGDWAFLGPVADEIERRQQAVIKVCSDITDPALNKPFSFYVGLGTARTLLFRTIEADRFVMTLPDIETFYLKRSVHPVHYFYIFHSIASIQRVYRKHAFDHYDTILCVGPHHEQEIRATEERYRLKPKRLLQHGYGRLDTLIRDLHSASRDNLPASEDNHHLRVLVAPTWGESSLIVHGLPALLRSLLEANYLVTLRLHPMTWRHKPSLAKQLQATFSNYTTFEIDANMSSTASLLKADIMVSEWSGSPLEYAFARLRPVLFIDTPPKINNPEFAEINRPSLEEDIREKIGCILPPDQMEKAPSVIQDLVDNHHQWEQKIRSVRDESVYNIGCSGKAGADIILNTPLPKG